MKIVKPETKEQVIYFLTSNISLGTYDSRFLSNLESTNLTYNKPLTSNQVILLDKIIRRYKRQIEKLEVTIEELVDAPWKLEPIQSSPQFTEVHLLLVEDALVLRSPYKKDFVTEFRKLDIQPVWHHEDRFWTIKASTHNLRVVKATLEKHYNKINYCDTINNLLARVDEYAGYKYWNPTIVCRNDRFYIYGINPSLNDAIADLDINISLTTITLLQQYAIAIDESALEKFSEVYTPEQIDFAKNETVTVEFDDGTLIENLKLLNTDFVLLMERKSTSQYFESLKQELSNSGIRWESYYDKASVPEYYKKFKNPAVISFGMNFFSTDASFYTLGNFMKSITIVSSKPIILK